MKNLLPKRCLREYYNQAEIFVDEYNKKVEDIRRIYEEEIEKERIHEFVIDRTNKIWKTYSDSVEKERLIYNRKCQEAYWEIVQRQE